jgi:hypothetical protein
MGHRIIADGEVLARVQFRNEEDASFFRSRLRWSHFSVVEAVAEVKPNAAPKQKGKAKPAAPAPVPETVVVVDDEKPE